MEVVAVLLDLLMGSSSHTPQVSSALLFPIGTHPMLFGRAGSLGQVHVP